MRLRCPGKHQIDGPGLRKEVEAEYIIMTLLQRDGQGAWGWGGKPVAPKQTGDTEKQRAKPKPPGTRSVKTEETSSQGEQGGPACEEEESGECAVTETRCKPRRE